MNDLRARLTRPRAEEMVTDPTQAYNLIRHAMTRLDFGGEAVYLEQDVLAFAVDGRIHVVEIKSYPRIDGRADPTKASAYRPPDRGLRPEPAAAHGGDRRTAQRGQHHHDDRAAGEPLLPADRGDNRHRHVHAPAAAPTRIGSAGGRDPRRHPCRDPAAGSSGRRGRSQRWRRPPRPHARPSRPFPRGSQMAASPARCSPTAVTRRNCTAPPYDSVLPWPALAATSPTSPPALAWLRAAAHRPTLPRRRSRRLSRGAPRLRDSPLEDLREPPAHPPGSSGCRRAAGCREGDSASRPPEPAPADPHRLPPRWRSRRAPWVDVGHQP